MPAEVGLVSASWRASVGPSSSRPCSTKVVTWEDTKNTASRRRLSSQSPQPALASSSWRSVMVSPSGSGEFIQPSSFNPYHAFQTACCIALQVTDFKNETENKNYQSASNKALICKSFS